MIHTYATDVVSALVKYINSNGFIAYEYARPERLDIDQETGSFSPFVVVSAGVEFLRQQEMLASNNLDAERQANISLTFYGAFSQENNDCVVLMKKVHELINMTWKTDGSSVLRDWYSGQPTKVLTETELPISLIKITRYYRCSVNLPYA